MPKLALFGGTPAIASLTDMRLSWRKRPLDSVLAEYVGTKYAYSVGSGTDALVSALLGVGVLPGDEVITTPYTWVATVSSILHLGAIPIFADISPTTFCIDIASVRERVSPRTKAILAVDMYGHPAPIREILQIGAEISVAVVEDACQAITATIDGKKVGSIADATAFSWAGKPVYSRYDCGGAFTTNSEEIFQRALLAGQHPFDIRDSCNLPEAQDLWSMGGLGHNYRPTSNDALEQLWDADVRAEARRRNAAILTKGLADIPYITPPVVAPECEHAYHFYTCIWDEVSSGVTRNRFCEALAAEGVEVWAYIDMIRDFTKPIEDRASAAGPIHLRPLFRPKPNEESRTLLAKWRHHLPDYSDVSLPVSEVCAKAEFCLPQLLLEPPCGREEMVKVLNAVTKIIENIHELQ